MLVLDQTLFLGFPLTERGRGRERGSEREGERERGRERGGERERDTERRKDKAEITKLIAITLQTGHIIWYALHHTIKVKTKVMK